MKLNGKAGGADGIRADVDGNIWAAAGGGRGLRRRPRVRARGTTHRRDPAARDLRQRVLRRAKRNRLFMTASQSLYAVYVGTRGAHIS